MFQIARKEEPKTTAYSLLLDDLERARYDLALAYDNFENAMEPDLIDCCIYQVNALQMRYKFLLRENNFVSVYFACKVCLKRVEEKWTCIMVLEPLPEFAFLY